MYQDILNDCPELLRQFLFYMETIRGRSSTTIKDYYVDLRTFFRYLKSVKLLHQYPESNDEDFKNIKIADLSVEFICSITLNDVYEFLHFTLDKLQNSSVSRSRKVSSIRSFYHYIATKTTYLEENPVKNLEVPTLKKTMPKYLTLEESLELLSGIHTNVSPRNARDYCMITLMLNCGMRVSELVGINLTDIRDDTLKLLGKGNKERIVFLNGACQSAIAEYLKVRKAPEKSPDRSALFLSRNGRRITARRVEQIVEECLKNVGLGGRGYSPHKLRHTAATLMYQHGGVDIRVLKEILGHANLGTTEIYTHVSDQQIKIAADKSPLSKVVKKQSDPQPEVDQEDTEEEE